MKGEKEEATCSVCGTLRPACDQPADPCRYCADYGLAQ